MIKGHALQKLLIGLKFTDDYFLNGIPKTEPIDDPKSTSLHSSCCRGTIDFIQKSKFTKSFPIFENFCRLIINFNLDWSCLDNKEASSTSSLSEDDGSFRHSCPKHMFLNIVEFFFWEVVKDEMIFKRVEDEFFVCFSFRFSHGLYSLVPYSKSYLVKTVNFILLLKFLNHFLLLLLSKLKIWSKRKKYSKWENIVSLLHYWKVRSFSKVYQEVAR